MNLTNTSILQNRYHIQALLGRGGMGNVYRAEDTQAGQIVAIKALKTEFLEDAPDLLERFTREGQALSQLHHPNIVDILAHIDEGEQQYIVMAYMPGGSLRDRLSAEGALPLADVLEIALDLADALTRTHRLNIIHRDIKPDNVMLAEDGTPRLTDFGVASIAGRTRVTETGALVGTFAYLSPEACRGEPIDERTDIWSFGVLLYELLAGHNPFRREMAAATIQAILNAPLPPLQEAREDVPEGLAHLIGQMLEKDVGVRLDSVRLVGAQIEAIIRGLDTPVRASLGTVAQKVAEPGGSRFATPPDSFILQDQDNATLPPDKGPLVSDSALDGSVVQTPPPSVKGTPREALYQADPNSWLYVHEDDAGNTEVHVGRFIHVVENKNGVKDIHFGFVGQPDTLNGEKQLLGLKGPPVVVGVMLLLLLGMCMSSCFALGLLIR